MDETGPDNRGQDDRREFLKNCGRFVATVPPVMTVLLSTSLSSKAIAASTGGGGDRGVGRSADTPGPNRDNPGPNLDTPRPYLDNPGPNRDTPRPRHD